jgi:hypothetical protein
MNQSKVTLADALILVGTIIYGFYCFLSLYFLTLGNTNKSILFSSGIAIILGGLAFGAKLLKRTPGNFKASKIWEWVLVFLYVVIAVLSIKTFSHYFTVTSQKEEIKHKITSDIIQAEGLFKAYEDYVNNRLNIYQSRLESIVERHVRGIGDGEYRKYGFVDDTDNKIQIENKMFTLKAQLYPSNYNEFKEVSTTWLASSKTKIANWSPMGIVKVLNSVKTEITSWNKQLEDLSAFKAQGEKPDPFEYPLAFNDATNYFTNVSAPNMISIGYAIGLHLLILLSYFITKKHTRNPGLKVIFGTRHNKENEL